MKHPAWHRRAFLRIVASALMLLLLASSARSTYSIIVVDTATGEVCVALASCHPGGVNLKRTLPVVVVGKGAGVVQALTDQTGVVRQLIRNALETGVPPQEIIDYLGRADRHGLWRQIAVVDLVHAPAALTGINAKQAALSITGVDASLHYSIQGNILVGNKVVQLAEQAFLQSRGDLGQRVMRAMETMRAWGGDGRCSCDPVAPTSCGVPPPAFTKSAHTGFLVIARPGDADGGCNKAQGCATGNYYLELHFQGDIPDPDPVLMLQAFYDSWRLAMAGRPDHFHSRVDVADQALVADNLSSTVATIQLVDLEGHPLTHGGAQVHVEYLPPGKSRATVSSAIDNGDGTYSMTLTAGHRPGHDQWRVVVDDGQSAVVLGSKLEIVVEPLVELHSGHFT